MRIANVTGGELLINDVNVNNYDPIALRRHISVLSQEVGEFLGLTISDNIGIGDVENIENASAVRQSAQEAGAAEFIEQLPYNYDSYLGDAPGSNNEIVSRWDNIWDIDSDSDSEDSDDDEELKEQKKRVQRDLSGGQWQKLGLARAFMRRKDADLMVLDEPTASLDPEAEFKLFETIKKTREGKTTLYISHRFNAVKLATQIMVLDDGKVVEFGAHTELMGMPDGKYRELYSLQARGFSGESV